MVSAAAKPAFGVFSIVAPRGMCATVGILTVVDAA
jgi:hypothetical protein